jgi:ABC-type transport system substrate-binding protein
MDDLSNLETIVALAKSRGFVYPTSEIYGGLGSDLDSLRNRFLSTSPYQGFTRIFGYSNPEFDKLALEQMGMMDKDARRELLNQMQVILANDVPEIQLYYATRVTIYNSEVFDAWYYTPGGFGGGNPDPLNKHLFVTGEKEGLP